MAKIKSVQAADPGVGFVLDLTDELTGGRTLPNLTVIVRVSDSVSTYNSTIKINDTVSNTDNVANPSLVFIAPFGDTRYAGGQNLSISFTVVYYTDPIDPRTMVTLLQDTQTVTSDSRPFKILLNRSFLERVGYDGNSTPDELTPGLLLPGQQLTSPNGQYLAIFGTDGSLYLKTSDGRTLGSTGPSGVTSFAIMQGDGNFCMYRGTPDNNLGVYFSIPEQYYSSSHYLVLTDSGVLALCDNYAGNNPVYTILQA